MVEKLVSLLFLVSICKEPVSINSKNHYR